MSDPTTARAMAFRVEDMEIEERVEALEQWGEELREAGFRAGHAQVPTPEPGEPETGFEQRWAKTLDAAEQPSSLVRQVQSMWPDLNEPYSSQEQAAFIWALQALDALTAENAERRSSLAKFAIYLGAQEELVGHLKDALESQGHAIQRLEVATSSARSKAAENIRRARPGLPPGAGLD